MSPASGAGIPRRRRCPRSRAWRPYIVQEIAEACAADRDRNGMPNGSSIAHRPGRGRRSFSSTGAGHVELVDARFMSSSVAWTQASNARSSGRVRRATGETPAPADAVPFTPVVDGIDPRPRPRPGPARRCARRRSGRRAGSMVWKRRRGGAGRRALCGRRCSRQCPWASGETSCIRMSRAPASRRTISRWSLQPRWRQVPDVLAVGTATAC